MMVWRTCDESEALDHAPRVLGDHAHHHAAHRLQGAEQQKEGTVRSNSANKTTA